MSDESPTFEQKKPDLNWSQVRETVLMLNLAVAQLERTMKEGDESVNTLTDTFASLIGSIQAIDMAAENLPDTPEKETITNNIAPVSEKVNTAIVAFQFYDKLSQRLTHVSNSLAELGKLVGDSNRLYNPYEWFGLQAMIQSKYTIESDREMFKAIHEGATVEEALALSEQGEEGGPEEGEVELF